MRISWEKRMLMGMSWEFMGISCTNGMRDGDMQKLWPWRPYTYLSSGTAHTSVVRPISRGSCEGKVKQNEPLIRNSFEGLNGFWANLAPTLGAHLARQQSCSGFWSCMFSYPVFELVFDNCVCGNNYRRFVCILVRKYFFCTVMYIFVWKGGMGYGSNLDLKLAKFLLAYYRGPWAQDLHETASAINTSQMLNIQRHKHTKEYKNRLKK